MVKFFDGFMQKKLRCGKQREERRERKRNEARDKVVAVKGRKGSSQWGICIYGFHNNRGQRPYQITQLHIHENLVITFEKTSNSDKILSRENVQQLRSNTYTEWFANFRHRDFKIG